MSKVMEASVVQPTPERTRHDPVVISDKQIADSAGNIGSPFRVLGIIPMLYERKAIRDHHVLAAFGYMDDFDTAKLEPLHTAPFEIRGKGKEEFSNHVMRAKESIWKARKALCLGTAVERAAWAILGMRWNFKEWVDREGGIFSEQTAKRLLIAALTELADHYGFKEKKAS